VVDASSHLRHELDRFGLTKLIGADRYFESLNAAREAFHASKTS